MDLFLLRHGCAEPSAARDRDRRLTAAGREELHTVLRTCHTSLSAVTRVLASPYVRTQQTCDLALDYLPHFDPARRETADFLTPGSNTRKVWQWLGTQPDTAVLLVTHQPLIGAFLDELCGFEPGRYRLGTAALAAVRLDTVAPGLGELLWLKQP